MTEETYRPYRGVLRRLPLRFWPLAKAGIATLCKRPLPLVLIYAVPTIFAIVFSFNVYARFALEEGNVLGHAPPGVGGKFAAAMAAKLLEVRAQISEMFTFIRAFTLLCTVWFGAGVMADDRRLGAHLLLFSRPLTRLDYLLARFVTVAFFAALCSIGPVIVVCTTAVFSSPDWSFLKHDYGVILGSLAFGLVTTVFFSLVVLAVSSIASRKVFAMGGVFAAIFIPHGIGLALWRFNDEPAFRIVSPMANLGRVGNWILGRADPWFSWPWEHSALALGGYMALCIAVLLWRVRRLEVVA